MKIQILVIDDYMMTARAIAKVLTLSGHEAWAAKSGQEALNILKTKPIDMVLVDNNMLYMSGPEFIGIAKPVYPDMRFILMGAEDFDTELSVLADACGADAHLNKSFDFKDLEQMIQTLMSNRHPRL